MTIARGWGRGGEHRPRRVGGPRVGTLRGGRATPRDGLARAGALGSRLRPTSTRVVSGRPGVPRSRSSPRGSRAGEGSRGHAQPLASWWLRTRPAMRTAPASPHATTPDRARTGVQHRPLPCRGTTLPPPPTSRSAANSREQEGITSLAIQFDASADGLEVHAAILQRLREREHPPRSHQNRLAAVPDHTAVVGMYGRCDLGRVVPAEPGESVGVWNETLTAEYVTDIRRVQPWTERIHDRRAISPQRLFQTGKRSVQFQARHPKKLQPRDSPHAPTTPWGVNSEHARRPPQPDPSNVIVARGWGYPRANLSSPHSEQSHGPRRPPRVARGCGIP